MLSNLKGLLPESLRTTNETSSKLKTHGDREIIGKIIVIDSEHDNQLGKEFPVYSLPTYLGRASDNGVLLTDASVSRSHAKITLINNQTHLHDLGSRFGTYLNNEKLKSTPEQLVYGDKMKLGDTANLIFAPVQKLKTEKDSEKKASIAKRFEGQITMVKKPRSNKKSDK